MKLFVVRHTHDPDRCPARDRNSGLMLLSHLSDQNARQFGITIKSDAVVDGKHTLYLTVEARDSQSIEEFMKPFAEAGTVEILPASNCEVVVERGAC